MMDWQFWTQLLSWFGTLLAFAWFGGRWLERQFNTTRENAHKILEKHEEKDQQRHSENVQRLNELEIEHTKSIAGLKSETSERLTAVEVRVAEMIRAGGKRTGPGYTA